MKRFLKDNAVLVVGVSLPLVVVVLFLIASNLPRALGPPPAYDFLFVTNHYDHTHPVPVTVTFDVSGQRLRTRLYKATANQGRYVPKLYLYDHARQTVRQLTVDLPQDAAGIENGIEIEVQEAVRFLLDTNRKAPDGYEFRSGYGRRRGLFGELFGGGSRYRQAVVKDGAVYPIPQTDGSYGGSIQFLGWVVGEDT